MKNVAILVPLLLLGTVCAIAMATDAALSSRWPGLVLWSLMGLGSGLRLWVLLKHERAQAASTRG